MLKKKTNLYAAIRFFFSSKSKQYFFATISHSHIVTDSLYSLQVILQKEQNLYSHVPCIRSTKVYSIGFFAMQNCEELLLFVCICYCLSLLSCESHIHIGYQYLYKIYTFIRFSPLNSQTEHNCNMSQHMFKRM